MVCERTVVCIPRQREIPGNREVDDLARKGTILATVNSAHDAGIPLSPAKYLLPARPIVDDSFITTCDQADQAIERYKKQTKSLLTLIRISTSKQMA